MALARTKEGLEALLKLTEQALYEEKDIERVSLRMRNIFHGHGENAQALLDLVYTVVPKEGTPLVVAELLSSKLRGEKALAYTAVREQTVLVERAVSYYCVAEKLLQGGFDEEWYAAFSALTSFISKNYGIRSVPGLDSSSFKIKLFRELFQGKLKDLSPLILKDILENHTDAENNIDLKLETKIITEKSFPYWIQMLVSEVEQVDLISIAQRKELKKNLSLTLGAYAPYAYIVLSEAKPRILSLLLHEGYLKDFLYFFERNQTSLLRTQVIDTLNHFMFHAEHIVQTYHGAGEDARKDAFSRSLQKIQNLHSLDDLLSHFREARYGEDKNLDQHLVRMRDSKSLYEKISSVFALQPLVVIEHLDGFTTSCPLPVSIPQSVQLPEFVRCFDTEEKNMEVFRFLLYIQSGMGRYSYWSEKTKEKDKGDKFSKYSNPDFARAIFSSLAYACVFQDIEHDLPRLGKQLRATATCIKERYESGLFFSDTVQKHEQARELIERYLVLGVSQEDSPLYKSLVPHLRDISRDILDQKVEEIYTVIHNLVGIPSQTNLQSISSLRNGQRRSLTLSEQTGSKYSGQVISYYSENGQGVRVIEMESSPHPNLRVQEIRIQNRLTFERLRSLFEALKPERVIHETRVYDGEIDSDLYLDALLDAKVGFSPDTNVFRNRLLRERDHAILLTADLPRKVMTPLAKPSSGKIIQLDYIRQTFVTMADVFAVMDDDFALMSYGSRGAQEVFVNILKDFSEPYDTKVEQRMGMMAPILHSRTGSVYHRFADRFNERSAARKIHIDIVSQLALDVDYKRPESVAMTVGGASLERAAGIELFALCLDNTVSNEMLTEIYGSGHFVRIQNVSDLDRSAIQLYKFLCFS